MPHTIYGKSVGDVSFGMMALGLSANPPFSDEDAFAAIKAAIDSGCTYFNGAEFYGPSERNSLTILAKYFEKYPEDATKVVLNVKGGLGPKLIPRGDKESMVQSLENCLKALGPVGRINVFAAARKDPNVDYVNDTLGTINEYVKAGKIDGISCSELNANSLRNAAKAVKIDFLEIELSLFHLDAITNGTLKACDELGITVGAYSPLGGGLLGRKFTSPEDIPANDYRRNWPRFQGQNFYKNLELVSAVERLAEKKGCTASQIAINWVLALSKRPGMPKIMVIQGSANPHRIKENSVKINLSDEDLSEIDEILQFFVTAGDRYPSALMEYVNI